MTDEQMRVKIAEACGLEPVTMPFNPNEVEVGHNGQWFAPVAAAYFRKLYPKGMTPKVIPDYPNDLNACHEMEKVLDRAKDLCPGMEVPLTQYDQYWGALTEVTKGDIIHATARQRCEAFLKTIGKWEEKQ